MGSHSKLSRIFALTVICVLALVGCGTAQPTPTAASQTRATSVPTEVVATTAATAEAASTNVVTADATTETTVSTVTCAKLNLNTLTETELTATIPNFASRMVREFFEYRPYVSIQQFRQEIGKYVDDAQVAEYEQYVFVPVDPNTSDVATLMQIPGVDEALAATLTANRPYASQQAFVDALGESLSAEQIAQASCYLAAAS